MSQNIEQIYLANPITTNASTDLMYFGQSPYGAGDDAAMTFANFNAQIVATGTVNDLAYYASSGNKVSALATLNNGVLITSNTGVPSLLANSGTPGYVLTANSAAPPSWQSVSASGAITTIDGDSGSATPSAGVVTINGGSTGLTTSGSSHTLSLTGILALANGGTNANLTASNGGIFYSTATAGAILSGTATAGKVLQSGSTAAPTWSTPTYPSASGTSGQVLASDGTNIIYSTATFPVVGGAAGNILISDGTNYIASTSLWPNTVGSTGTILRSNGTSNAYTTSTFADTYAVSTLLYAASSNTVSGLATANSAALVTNGSGVPAWQVMSAGQILIGTTAGAPAAAAINSGAGILVANGSGSITISATGGGIGWTAAPSTPVTAAINTGYIVTDASTVTFTLPTTAAIGSVVRIAGQGAGGWVLAPGAGQTIKVLTASASTSVASTEAFDCIEVVCTVDSTTWVTTSFVSTGFTIT